MEKIISFLKYIYYYIKNIFINENNKEIEKKFIVSELPENLKIFKKEEIYQTYIALYGDEEVRIRVVDEKNAFLTYKKGKGKVRIEKEIPISIELAATMIPKNKKGLQKTRSYAKHKGKVLEIDIFKGIDNLNNKFIVEIEFFSKEELENYMFPIWLKKECNFSNKDVWNEINQ